jgi:uncharacterized beta-barrel protein YwiB (DUF1934 family)
MSKLSTEIEKHIKKLIHPLKDSEELEVSLKTKFTKKERKLLNAWAEEQSSQNIQTDLNLSEERYAELSTKLIKKLNQERIKQALCV